MRIRILATAEVEKETLDHLLRKLGRIFLAEVRLEGVFELLPAEFDPVRGQYRSTPILKRLYHPSGPDEYLLAVTEADLFAAGLNFVFGEADQGTGCTIISLARLRAELPGRPPTKDLFLRRALTEAMHEIGHLLGLPHCPQEICVMHFSNSLAETDIKRPVFCDRCHVNAGGKQR